MAGFADLNLPQGPDKKSLQSLLETAAHLGYSTVALNHVIDFKEKKQEIVKPVCPSELFPSLPIVQGTSKRIKVLTRLTLVVSDPSHCNLLRSTSANIRLYDIIAVFPKTEKLFHISQEDHLGLQQECSLHAISKIACTTLDVDLVCINVTEKLPFYFRRPPVNMAIDRGIFFELLYAPAIKDSTMRRYTISNAISLMQICKGKNIVISSAAERVTEVCCLACQKVRQRQPCLPTAEPPSFMEKLGRVPVGLCTR
ncbi:ribonuclease P protein subunit p30 isoform X3 [Patagioenas fasciata]|uniref:ribonuclease P protein subunit p30 isoform X3 n=1 Tax=Patagioenas fasciata TaxID=372321 RepID=UPI003A990661